MTADEKKYFNQRLETLDSKLDRNLGAVNKLETTVTGNGGKGHEQRIEDLESWQQSRPRSCPLEIKRKNIYARRALDAMVIGLVLTVLLFLADRYLPARKAAPAQTQTEVRE